MAHLCVPQNQALGVCRGFAPDIQICGTHGRKNLVNATIISNAEEEEILAYFCVLDGLYHKTQIILAYFCVLDGLYHKTQIILAYFCVLDGLYHKTQIILAYFCVLDGLYHKTQIILAYFCVLDGLYHKTQIILAYFCVLDGLCHKTQIILQYNSDICNSLKRKLGYMQAIWGVPAKSLLCFTCKTSVKSNSHICKFAYMQVLFRSHPPI